MDGEPVCACLMTAAQAKGRKIETVQGLSHSRLHEAFARHGAAQCGICTPGMMMAASALLARDPKPSKQSIHDAIGGVLCRCTGYARIVDAIADLAFENSDIRAIRRIDGEPKINGRERYGADVAPPGALLVRAIRSPHASAKFTLGDLDAWRQEHPGIEAILTAADIPGRNRFGVIPPLADQPALAEGFVRHRLEAIAIVIGAAELVETIDLETFPVTWHIQPEALRSEEAEQVADLHEGRNGNTLIRGRVITGDVDKGLEGAAVTVNRSITTSFVEHAYIEPEAGCAWLDGDTVVIAACTQAPIMDRDDLAILLNKPQDQVRVIPTAVGGGFGAKLDLSIQPLIALATLHTGKPCKMTLTRRESMATTTKRHPELKISVAKFDSKVILHTKMDTNMILSNI